MVAPAGRAWSSVRCGAPLSWTYICEKSSPPLTSPATGMTTALTIDCTKAPDAALPRPGRLPDGAVRPARLRTLDALRRARREHHLAPGVGHGSDPHPSRDRALAALRRLLGVVPVAGLCRDPHQAGERTDPPR